jgi:hypothetical protein
MGWVLRIEMPSVCDHLSSVNHGIRMMGYSTADRHNVGVVDEAAVAPYQRRTLLRVQIPIGSKVPIILIWEVSEQPPAIQAFFFGSSALVLGIPF